MRPDHEFKANFSPSEPAADAASINRADTITLYEGESTVRNLCLVWPDGRRAFFNYAYLVAGDLTIQSDISTLLLSFGSYEVLLKGYCLISLYNLLVDHAPKFIVVLDPRYIPDDLRSDYLVIDALVKNEQSFSIK